jgi:hypothetical protein
LSKLLTDIIDWATTSGFLFVTPKNLTYGQPVSDQKSLYLGIGAIGCTGEPDPGLRHFPCSVRQTSGPFDGEEEIRPGHTWNAWCT